MAGLRSSQLPPGLSTTPIHSPDGAALVVTVRTEPPWHLVRPAQTSPGPAPVNVRSKRTGRPSRAIRLTQWANSLRSEVEIEGFAFIPPEVTERPSLSYRAIGLLSYLYTFPADQPPTLVDLLHENPKDGRQSVLTAIALLAEHGFVEPLYAKARIPAELRIRVLKRDGFRCVNCDADEDLMADHVITESKGGETTFENLQTLCRPCNSHKGSKREG